MRPSMRLAAVLGSVSAPGLAAVWFAEIASAQGSHQHGSPSTGSGFSTEELTAGIAHGTTLGAIVFLAGLVAFVTLVWLPSDRVEDADQEKAVNLLCRWMWVLVGLLVAAGLVELSLYAVRASGEAFSPGLFQEALFDTTGSLLKQEKGPTCVPVEPNLSCDLGVFVAIEKAGFELSRAAYPISTNYRYSGTHKDRPRGS